MGVWKEEKSALEERKAIDRLKKEREEERAIEELQRLQAESGGKTFTKRVDWMYAGPSGEGADNTERESYLLGKRRIDHLLKSDDTQSLQKGAAVGIDTVGASIADTSRDTHKKVLQDPLLLIQKQKMEMQLKAAKDAAKEAKYVEKRLKEKEREKRHKDKGRDRERSRDRERKHRSRRERSRSRSDDYEDRSREHRSRRGEGSRSRVDDYKDRDRRERKHRRHDRDDRDGRDSRRRRSRTRSRSRSPYRKSHRDEDRKRTRSRSPRIREDRDDRDTYRRRDPMPARHSHDNYKPRRDWGEDHPVQSAPAPSKAPEEPKESAAERLAKMQAAASSLEEQRAERVREQEIKDAEEAEKLKKNMDGGQRLISKVRGQASNMDLGDAIARGRQGGLRIGEDI
ncbi:RNA-splicing factor [Neocucurbitaria cava]|uniref:RNA-splicing factor n=1 Tax=Neocucurbitaria cava TaxID=798079 RepID=A0A9W9CKZ3_9PLEO|nr:RNA-splicing factor [Neocucurbitaria cava]